MDAKLLRSVMGQFATGVTVVTFVANGQPAGMTANAFMSVSLEPPLILISIRNASSFNQFVGEGVHFGVNFLAESQRWLSGHFGGRPEEGGCAAFHLPRRNAIAGRQSRAPRRTYGRRAPGR